MQEACRLKPLPRTQATAWAWLLFLCAPQGALCPQSVPSPHQVPITAATSFTFLIFGFRPPEVVTLASFLWRNDSLRCYHLPHLPEFPPSLESWLPKRSNSSGGFLTGPWSWQLLPQRPWWEPLIHGDTSPRGPRDAAELYAPCDSSAHGGSVPGALCTV